MVGRGKLIIQVVNVGLGTDEAPNADTPGELPPWCNVYEGLSDEQIADIERSIVQMRSSRTFD